MSKLFIDTVIQHGGDLSNKDKVSVLNIVSKHINKKMKIIEYDYKIKLKLDKLPENNSDCMPKTVGIQSVANVNGPIKGQIPFYTTTQLAVPSPNISTVNTAVPLTPFGPVVGVPSLAVNPFGNSGNLDNRIKKANETLEIMKKITLQLDKFNNKEIEEKDLDKKYFEFINLNDDEEKTMEEIEKILNKAK